MADRHLAGCAQCRIWLDRATALNRLARTSVVRPPMTVDEELLAAVPSPGRARLAGALRIAGTPRLAGTLRIALGVVGVAQFLLGAAQIAGIGDAGHPHGLDVVLGGGPNHLWHESAAWNVALGAGFAWIAIRRTRPLGLVPTLTAFVAVLTLLSINDAIAGRVDVGRILSHGLILAGYLIILGLSRSTFESDGPPTRHERRRGSAWRATFEEDQVVAPPRLRLVRSRPRTAQARSDHRAA